MLPLVGGAGAAAGQHVTPGYCDRAAEDHPVTGLPADEVGGFGAGACSNCPHSPHLLI